MNAYNIRELRNSDYKKYLDIMFEFTNYKYDISEEDFNKHLYNIHCFNLKKIIVIELDNNIIGTGTIFKLEKIHNNPIGQIEDVIITKKYRGNGFGKIIIDKLIIIGLNDFKCYKVILNCLDKNIDFYKKCGFEMVGNEMKYVNNLYI